MSDDNVVVIVAEPADDEDIVSDWDSAGTSTTSLSSSVVNYVYENGRRYHAYREGSYIIPNDEREQDRLDLVHHIYNMLEGGELHRAPLSNPQNILDLGTGTGIWAIDMADKFPEAHVIGNDLSPIQPVWVPTNCTFEVDDIESEWTYEENQFDLIHARTLGGSIADWPRLYETVYKHLKPGGWFEIVEMATWAECDDGTMLPDSPLRQLGREMDKACKIINKEFNIAHQHKNWMFEAGFENISETIKKIPLNTWAKDRRYKALGQYHHVNAMEGLDSYCLAAFTRVLNWSKEDAVAFLSTVRKELQNLKVHSYNRVNRVIGQKPVQTR